MTRLQKLKEESERKKEHKVTVSDALSETLLVATKKKKRRATRKRELEASEDEDDDKAIQV